MSKIVSIHSFRGGTGKSNTTANLAALLAQKGRRVGVVDTDIQSPGIHILFGFDETQMVHSLNDYLWGKCPIQATAHDVTSSLGSAVDGSIVLIPSSLKAGEIARILREGYDVGLLNDGFQDLLQDLNLDLLMIDTHPGLNEETLLSLAISDTLLVLLRPDQQDYLGTAVTVEVARRLDVPEMLLVVNKVPELFPHAEVKSRVERAYNCEVVAVLPHSEEMMALGSSSLFVLRYPHHLITTGIQQIASRLCR